MKIKQLLKKITLITLISVPNLLFAQLGINSTGAAPATNAMLDVSSPSKGVLIPRVAADLASPSEGLLYYNTTGHNFRYYDGTAWQNALFGNQWNVNGNKISYSLGNVGIGVGDPLYKLHVNGNFHTSGFITTDGYIGIGGYPNYKLSVFDGSLAITNSTDAKTWSFNYNSGNNGLQFNEDGTTSRLNIENGGNVGIGITNPAYKLDVAGTIHASSSIIADGNATINGNASVDGSMTVNNGKGVAYNTLGATNLKIYPFTTGTFGAVLGAHGSAEGNIIFNGGFTSAPRVFVGDIDYTAGISGELERVILILRGCTYSAGTTTCLAKLVNTDNASVNYDIRWNMLAVGY